jgi:ABC-type lipoprotein release transport system permease subunit
MNTILTIAVRNVLRNKRRTVLTAITMTAGIAFFIMLDSLFSGMDRGAIDNMVNLALSSVKITTRAYEADHEAFPLDYGINNLRDTEAFLLKQKRVKAVAPRTSFLAQLSNYENSLPVLGIVVDPEKDKRVFTLADYTKGPGFSSDSKREIILGSDLAKELGVKPGDPITLSARSRFDAQNADDFTVAGVVTTSDPTLNKSAVYISFEAANDFIDLGGLVTELDVSLERRTNLADFVADSRGVALAVSTAFPELYAQSFRELGAGFLALLKQKRSWSLMIILIVLLIAAVGIVNTVLMSVYERIREVGVLRAFGLEKAEIVRMFLFEGTIIGLVGSILGVILGALSVWYLTAVGYPVDKFFGNISGGMPIWGTLYGEWNPGTMAFAFCFGVATAVIASIVPARKAAGLEVTNALRFV